MNRRDFVAIGLAVFCLPRQVLAANRKFVFKTELIPDGAGRHRPRRQGTAWNHDWITLLLALTFATATLPAARGMGQIRGVDASRCCHNSVFLGSATQPAYHSFTNPFTNPPFTEMAKTSLT